jgi:hypothetical protein
LRHRIWLADCSTCSNAATDLDTALWRLGVTMPTAMVLGSRVALKQAALGGIAAA